MLEINNLNISIKDRKYLDNFNLVLKDNDKAAIIGEEGNGKSTLLKTIINKADYAITQGLINTHNCHIGYMPQKIEYQGSVFDYLFSTEYDYETAHSTLYRELDFLNLQPELIYRDMETLSGGEKVKVCLLKLKLNRYDLYLLDEPTNDLDLETLNLLETFINETSEPILFISHDETLIQNCANIIIHIEQLRKKTVCSCSVFYGDYISFTEFRNNTLSIRTRQALSDEKEFAIKKEKLNRLMNKIEYAQNNVSRQNPHEGYVLKKKMKQLKSQEGKLGSVQLREYPDSEEGISFFFENVKSPEGKRILDFSLDKLMIDERILAKNIHLCLNGGSHIAITGQNGSGKSTLLHLIYESLKDRKDIKAGYMPQNYEECFDTEYVLDYLVKDRKAENITKALIMLGNMKFTKEEMQGLIKDLSGGSKAKLILVKLCLEKYDVLLLDEPSRNLSPLSCPVLRRALNGYDGTIIMISHDRKLLNECAHSIYRLDVNGLTQTV